MTAYVALDAVRQGRLSMSSLLTVSREAAAMPPSKMGFEPGSQITLDNALKIIMVKSANDVAWTIAENVGGSVERFVDEMNATARRLGMNETRFTNPSGLPDLRKEHVGARHGAPRPGPCGGTSRASATSGASRSIAFGSTVMNNHNGLVGRYPGAAGLKTGYVCSSGFNVVAIAERGGRRLVVVVMGQLSSRERTALSASLMEQRPSPRAACSASAATGARLRDMPRSSRTAPQDFRPIVCDPNRRRDRGEEDAEEIVRRRGEPGRRRRRWRSFQAQRATLPVVDLPERRPVAPIQVSLGLPTGIAPGPEPHRRDGRERRHAAEHPAAAAQQAAHRRAARARRQVRRWCWLRCRRHARGGSSERVATARRACHSPAPAAKPPATLSLDADGHSMRALRLHGDRDLRLETIDDPAPPAEGEVQIRVRAVALNYLDVWGFRGMAFAKRKLPQVAGVEASGEVVAVGPGVSRFSAGDPVVMVRRRHLRGMPRLAARGADNLCENVKGHHGLPRRRHGPRADEPARAARRPRAEGRLLTRTPPAPPSASARCSTMLFDNAGSSPANPILVHAGGSGIGTAAIKMAKAIGCTVYTTVGDDEKGEKARALGADHVVNYKSERFEGEVRPPDEAQGRRRRVRARGPPPPPPPSRHLERLALVPQARRPARDLAARPRGRDDADEPDAAVPAAIPHLRLLRLLDEEHRPVAREDGRGA